MAWECLRCARAIDLLGDDYCPVCGADLPPPDEVEAVDESLEGWPCRAGFAPDAPQQNTPRVCE